ncbi:MAG: hypothetical protein ACE5G5_05680 [Candidatus Methylomirabilales bacterium]
MAEPTDTHERAKRLARLIVSDIILYNQAKIDEGIKNDNLFEILTEDIEVARKYYEKHVDPAVDRETNYFELALVDILVKSRQSVESKIW